jgi:hypothetical protein
LKSYPIHIFDKFTSLSIRFHFTPSFSIYMYFFSISIIFSNISLIGVSHPRRRRHRQGRNILGKFPFRRGPLDGPAVPHLRVVLVDRLAQMALGALAARTIPLRPGVQVRPAPRAILEDPENEYS